MFVCPWTLYLPDPWVFPVTQYWVDSGARSKVDGDSSPGSLLPEACPENEKNRNKFTTLTQLYHETEETVNQQEGSCSTFVGNKCFSPLQFELRKIFRWWIKKVFFKLPTQTHSPQNHFHSLVSLPRNPRKKTKNPIPCHRPNNFSKKISLKVVLWSKNHFYFFFGFRNFVY